MTIDNRKPYARPSLVGEYRLRNLGEGQPVRTLLTNPSGYVVSKQIGESRVTVCFADEERGLHMNVRVMATAE